MSESPQTVSIWGWRSAAFGVVDCLKQLLDTGERSDVQFAVGREHGEEQLFQAHKLVLSLRSDVMDRMFYREIPAATEKTIQLPDILPQAFAIMLRYLYTDIAEGLNLENVLPTLYCATKYSIPKLVDICAQYAINNVDKRTCLTMLEAAKVLDAEKVVSRCLEIVDTNGTDLLQSEEFSQLKQETLREILGRDTLIVHEEEVYKAAQRWATNACQCHGLEPTAANYRFVLGEALFTVRFPLMTACQLADGPVAAGLLRDEELRKIFQVKYAAIEPDIPFSGTPRSSEFVFCDRQWEILDTQLPLTTMGNVFLDEHGHLHLLFARHDGVWKGAEVLLCETLGFGRYEFHIEGLDRLDPGSCFVMASEDVKGRVLGISVDSRQVSTPEGEEIYNGVYFSVRQPNYIALPAADGAEFRKCKEVPRHPHAIHSFHRKPDSISFSSRLGHQCNNSAEELCNWSYDSEPNIVKTPLAVSMLLYALTNPEHNAAYGGKEVEIVLHSFCFYPDEPDE